MTADRIGRFFLALGLLVGCAAGLGLLLGFEPSRLPAAMLDLAVYKLTFLAAFGLLAAGAVVARLARRDAERVAARTPPELVGGRPEGARRVPAEEPPVREPSARPEPRPARPR
jgi:hypothetical protein